MEPNRDSDEGPARPTRDKAVVASSSGGGQDMSHRQSVGVTSSFSNTTGICADCRKDREVKLADDGEWYCRVCWDTYYG